MAWSKEDWYEIDGVLQDIAHLLGKIEREERKQERRKKREKAKRAYLDGNGDMDERVHT